MKKIYLIVSLLSLLALSAGSALSPIRQDGDINVRITQIDTSEFPRVTFYVSIVDSEEQPVAVDPSRLVILENGEPIPLDQIEGIGDVGPLTTLLVMDVSGSMAVADKLESAKAAAHQYVDQMRAEDQAGLISFNTRIETVLPITGDQVAVREAIDSLSADGETAMYDALMRAIEELEGQEGRKAIIVLTDGMDNSSSAHADDVIDQIGPAGFSISTVGLGVPADYVDELAGIDEDGLMDLAERAGGVYGYAEDEEALTRLYQTYAIAMQSEYAITYTSPSTLRDGVNRALSVELAARSGGGEAVAGQSERYNPGGLVPEVPEPAAWPVFAGLLAAPLVLLVLPSLFGAVVGLVAQRRPKSSRVKLKKSPRVKLK